MSVTSLDRTAEFRERLQSRQARIGIVGMGYVGLPLALLFSEERFPVTGFDIDARKVRHPQSGWFLHRAHSFHRDRIGASKGLRRNLRLHQDCPDGCGHHLRAYSAERVP